MRLSNQYRTSRIGRGDPAPGKRMAMFGIDALKQETDQSLREILQRQAITTDELDKVTEQVSLVVDRAVATSRKVDEEVREETLSNAIVQLVSSHGPIAAHKTFGVLLERGYLGDEVVDAYAQPAKSKKPRAKVRYFIFIFLK